MDETRTVHVDPEHARRVIEAFSVQVGLPFREAYSPFDAAELARAHEYGCSPGTITEFIRKGYFGPVDPEALSPADVYCLFAALEARRRWQPCPSRHDAKKTGIRLAIEQLQADGTAPLHDLDDHSLVDLLLQLVQSDNRPLRELLYESLRLKLKDFEE